MVDVETLPVFARRGLWFAAAGAALTGFWLAPGATASAVSKPGVLVSILAFAGWAGLIGGLVGWSLLSNSRTERSHLARGAGVLFINVVTFWVSFIAVGIVGVNEGLCRPGESSEGPRAVGWLAPAIVYYAIGYFGFRGSRRLLLVWPLAIVAACLALLAVELIWTTGRCGD